MGPHWAWSKSPILRPIWFFSSWSVHLETKGFSSTNLWHMESSCGGLGPVRLRKHSIFLTLETWNLKQVLITHILNCVVWKGGNVLWLQLPLPENRDDANHRRGPYILSFLIARLVCKGRNDIVRCTVEVGQQQTDSRSLSNRFSQTSQRAIQNEWIVRKN